MSHQCARTRCKCTHKVLCVVRYALGRSDPDQPPEITLSYSDSPYLLPDDFWVSRPAEIGDESRVVDGTEQYQTPLFLTLSLSVSRCLSA